MHYHNTLIIGIPLFNEERYIRATLNSLSSQTHTDFLVFIADNSSEDGSGTICLDYAKNDHRFIYHHQKSNLGASANFKYIYENTQSPYFMWLGAHDLLHKDYIKTQLNSFTADPNLALVYSRTTWIDESGAILRESNGGEFVHEDGCALTRYLKTLGGPWGECTAINGVFRRSALSGIQFFSFPGPDHYILTRAQLFGKFHRTEDPIYFRREFKTKRSDYLERITGATSKSPFLKSPNMLPLAIAQTKEFFNLDIKFSEKIKHFPSVVFGFESAYGLYTSLIKNTLNSFLLLFAPPHKWKSIKSRFTRKIKIKP